MAEPAAGGIQILVLGGFEIVRGKQRLDSADWKRRKAAALLQRLALEGSLPKEKAIDFLWPESSLSSGSNNLYRTLYALRKVLNDAFGAEVDAEFFSFVNGVLFLGDGVWVDAVIFEQLADKPSATLAERQQAHALYQGELLPEDPYSDWLALPRESLRRLHRENSLALAAHYESERAYEEAVSLLAPLVAADPLDEQVHRGLMRLYALSGQQVAALRQYDLCAETLDVELGVEPEAETQALYGAIQSRQIVADAQRTEIRPPEPPRLNLPAQSTPFVGRSRELAEIGQLLQEDPPHRLVTLLGPGGIGKTRLALAVAASQSDKYAHGVFFVPLAPLESSEHIVSAVAERVGMRFFGAEDPREQLLVYLQARQTLLLLDNFEHLLAGSALVAEMLRRAPGLHIVVTSRERLNLSGEAVFPLGGLSYPDGATLSGSEPVKDAAQYDAVELFLQHARRARPRLVLNSEELGHVADICQAVQGTPLALVLAAGWAEMLSLEEIAAELSQSLDLLESQFQDLPPRQRSMRAAFDISWERLRPPEQDAFMNLSVFRGGFTRPVAHLVTGAALLTLRRLMHKSFVTVDENGRYQIHELLRQYAAEKLTAAGCADEARSVHSNYYLTHLHALEADVKGCRQLEAMREIEVDFENIRAAWLWAVERKNSGAIGQAVETLHLFCDMRARHGEGIALLERALEQAAASPEEFSQLIRARVLARMRFMQLFRLEVDFSRIETDLQESLALFQEHGERREIAYTLFALGSISLYAGDLAAARARLEKSVDLYQKLEDDLYQARVLNAVAVCHAHRSELEEELKYSRQSVALARAAGSEIDMSIALANLTESVFSLGDFEAARQYGYEAIEAASRVGFDFVVAQVKALLALEYFVLGEMARSGELLVESERLAQVNQFPLMLAYTAALRGILVGVQGDGHHGQQLAERSLSIAQNNNLGIVMANWALAIAHCQVERPKAAWQALLEAVGQAARLNRPVVTAWLLPIAVYLVASDGQKKRAVSLLALAATYHAASPDWQKAWPLFQSLKSDLIAGMSEKAYRRSWEKGQRLALSEVVAKLQVEYG